MTRRDNPVTTYLSNDEKKQLKEWSKETEKSQAHLLREAVLEYLDHDRTARVEEQIRDVNDKLDLVVTQLENGTENTHKATDKVEKARLIYQRVESNHGEVIKQNDLERAIEDIGGATDRTIESYKELLKRRGLLFAHPASNVWTAERDTWVEWCESKINNDPEAEVMDLIEDYDITVEDYDKVAETQL